MPQPKDFTAWVDQVTQRWRRRFVRERDLPNLMAPHYLGRTLAFAKPTLVVDVGANVGQYAQLLRRRLGYSGRLCSVEPIPEAAQALRQLAAGDSRWSVHEVALGREAARAQFNIMAGSEFSSLYAPAKAFEGRFHQQHRVAQTVEVQVQTLDQLAQSIGLLPGPRDVLLKLDTQGNELDVLAGGPQTLARVAVIQCEISLRPIYEGAPNAHQSIEAIQDLGFSLAALFPNNEGHFPHLLELDAIFVHTGLLPELA
jgi:FkbM family methyltransferase